MTGTDVMLDVQFRPWVSWPREETRARERSRFDTGWSETLNHLRREIGRVQGRNVVVQLRLDERDIRLDGWPRADARPRHPGVIVTFDTPNGGLQFAADKYVDYRDNLRAIGKTLEALRGVERWGASNSGEQYRGYAELPAGIAAATHLTTDGARELLMRLSGMPEAEIWGTREGLTRAYRLAARRAHPDGGGDPDLFVKLEEAMRLLRQPERTSA